MKFTQAFIPTLREVPAEAEVISHKLMLRAGMIRKLAAGVYNYLPLALRVLNKISNIVRDELNKAGAQELLLPIVMPRELWEETGRWPVYGKELLRFKDRHERDFCFGPTHEEAITDLVRQNIKSYRQLPVNLYQIQTKFRDEMRPRFGLMRGREFIMKDCYSFDVDEKTAVETYWKMFEVYKKIFTRCGLKFRPVEAGTGEIGGTLSHEFHVLASSGEDEVFVSEDRDVAYASDKVPADKKDPETGTELKSYRGIEVGQVFHLGTKYSQSMKATYLNEKGEEKLMVMGCYGIGISRTAAAAIEQNHDDNGIIWPLPIAPFAVELILMNVKDEAVKSVADKLYDDLQAKNIEVLYDDRDESAGVKFKDADLLGMPYRLVVGAKGLAEGKVELKNRATGEMEKVELGSVLEKIVSLVK